MGDFDEPFPGSWAVRAGLISAWRLRKDFERIHPDVYVRKDTRLDARGRAQAAAHWAKGAGVLTGFSAAAMHGTRWLDDRPAEIALPHQARRPAGVVTHRAVFHTDEIVEVDGFRCTTPARTAYDLARHLPFDEAVEVLDALCNATRLTAAEIGRTAESHPRARGCTKLATVLPYIDAGAESIPETRTRLLLVTAGLPAPETQIRILGADGLSVARLDMGWRRWRVAVDYDGAHHWTDRHQRAWDIDRAAALDALGWSLVRVSAVLLTTRPHVVIDRVTRALRAHNAAL